MTLLQSHDTTGLRLVRCQPLLWPHVRLADRDTDCVRDHATPQAVCAIESRRGRSG